MRFLPRSLKIITSASQLPENKYPLSPDPQNPWAPHPDPQLYPMFLSMKGRLCRACMVPITAIAFIALPLLSWVHTGQ